VLTSHQSGLEPHWDQQIWVRRTEAPSNEHLGPATPQPSSAPTPTPKTLSRIQPARAAKKRAAEQALGARQLAPRKKKCAAGSGPPSSSNSETRGDYTLAAYDWAQLLGGNEEEHGRSPRDYIQF
jgi:hypothetical protein